MVLDTIKQAEGSKDCLACVAAMATQTTVEEFKAYYRKHNLPSEQDITLIRYLWDYGYMVGTFAPEDDLWTIDKSFGVLLLSGPAYITVESDSEWVRKQGADHAVYWSGRRLHDPLPGPGKRLSEYKVKSILGIVKNLSHKRWKARSVDAAAGGSERQAVKEPR